MADQSAYSVLPEGHIRLLKCSKSDDGQLFCDMTSCALATEPDFYAFSYVWGVPSLSERAITCNGLQMKVRPNLYEALNTLYSPLLHQGIPIWIDAICINQQDDNEKAVQIGLMQAIYRAACQVIVWLGPSGQNSDIAMQSLVHLSDALFSLQLSLEFLLPKKQDGTPYNESDPIWPALCYLYRRQWFRRVWTFQEVVLAKSVLLFCGQRSVSWEVLARVTQELHRTGLDQLCEEQLYRIPEPFELSDDVVDGIRDIRNVEVARAWVIEKPMVFTWLLRLADTKICSDPRDRVYGMLGLTSQALRNRILESCTYAAGNSYAQVYIDCAKAFISEEGNLKILQLVAGRPRHPELPSWCPNLHCRPVVAGLFPNQPFRAGTSYTLFDRKLEITIISNVLSVTGFTVDTVCDVIEGTFRLPVNLTKEQEQREAQSSFNWLSRCLRLAQKVYNCPEGNIPNAHIDVVVCRTEERLPDSAALYRAYSDYMDAFKHVLGEPGGQYPLDERAALFADVTEMIGAACDNRTYFSSTGGQVGLGPPGIRTGDHVCVLYGSGPLYVLRPSMEQECTWELIGDAYLHGVMVLDETPAASRRHEEIFRIV